MKSSRECVFDTNFRENLVYWIREDKRTAARIMELVNAVMKEPFMGLGKPEPLKGQTDTWSRRITQEHRLVYVVADDRITFVQARYHY